MSKILVLIPAFNEGKNISRVIQDIRQVGAEFDILVVNDGSQDNTEDQARKAGAAVVSHPFNMGYGVTIQTGYKYAFDHRYDYLVQIDGDGQHDPEFINELLKPVMSGECDFSIGSRFLEEASYRPGLARLIGMAFFRKLVSVIIRQKMTDCTSGFQAFNRDVIKFFTEDAFPTDYPDSDVLITLKRAGFSIKEVPVRMFANQAGKSMHSGIRPLYYLFKQMLSILVTLLRSPKSYRGDE